MTKNETDAIWKRFRATTEGEWTLYSEGLVVEVTCQDPTPIVSWPGFDDSNRSPKKHKANAAFIAKAHQDVPKLLREIDRLDSLAVALGSSRAILLDNQEHLQAEVERLREGLRHYANGNNWKPALSQNGLGIHQVFIGYRSGDINGGDIALEVLKGNDK
jgi:hypothetical protein